MKMQDVRPLVVDLYTQMEKAGLSEVQQRAFLINQMTEQVVRSEAMLIMEICKSPVAGMNFIETIQRFIGVTNEVVIERGQQPIHINEIHFATSQTAVEYFGMDIDSLYQMYKEGTLFQ